MKFEPGSMFVALGKTWVLSNLIGRLTRQSGEHEYSHAFVVVKGGNNPEYVEIVQGVFPRVEQVTLDHELKNLEYAIHLDPIGASAEQRRIIVETAKSFLGRPYGVHKLPRLMLGLVLKSEEIQELELNPRLPTICTGIPGLCLEKAGLSWGQPTSALMASEMVAWARAHPEMWRVTEVK